MSFAPTAWRPYARAGTDAFRGTARAAIVLVQIGTAVYRAKGSGSSPVITGITRSNAGVALAGCDVRLYSAATNAVLAATTSDSGGNFSFTGAGTGPFYIRAYLPGSPDVAGVSSNLLRPA